MSTSKHLPLRVVLGCIFVVQSILGIAGLIGGKAAVKAVSAIYGGSMTMTPQLDYIVRMMGAYILAVAIMALLALINPAKSRLVIYGLISLMLLRFLDVVAFGKQAHEAFKIPMARVWGDGIIFLILAVFLFIFRPQ